MQTNGTYTVAAAAAQLGVSVDTIRRRVQAGTLEKVQLEKGYGVILEQPPAPNEEMLRQVLAERDRLVELVAFLQRQLEESGRRESALLKLAEGLRA